MVASRAPKSGTPRRIPKRVGVHFVRFAEANLDTFSIGARGNSIRGRDGRQQSTGFLRKQDQRAGARKRANHQLRKTLLKRQHGWKMGNPYFASSRRITQRMVADQFCSSSLGQGGGSRPRTLLGLIEVTDSPATT